MAFKFKLVTVNPGVLIVTIFCVQFLTGVVRCRSFTINLMFLKICCHFLVLAVFQITVDRTVTSLASDAVNSSGPSLAAQLPPEVLVFQEDGAVAVVTSGGSPQRRQVHARCAPSLHREIALTSELHSLIDVRLLEHVSALNPT